MPILQRAKETEQKEVQRTEQQRNTQDPEKQFKPETVISRGNKYLFRDLTLFFPELIAVIGSLSATLFLIFLTRFTLIGGLEQAKDAMGQEAYDFMAITISNGNLLVLLVGIIPLLLFTGFFVFRFVMFQPRKDKFETWRIFKHGGIKKSVDKLPANKELRFGKGFDSDKVKVSDPGKHWDMDTSKPIMVLFEGDAANANLNDYAQGLDEKAKDSNTVNDMSFHSGMRWERYNQEVGKKFWNNPMNILLLLILIIVAATAFFVLRQPDVIAGMLP